MHQNRFAFGGCQFDADSLEALIGNQLAAWHHDKPAAGVLPGMVPEGLNYLYDYPALDELRGFGYHFQAEKIKFENLHLFIPKFFAKELIMAVGWTRDGGIQDQIDASVEDAVKLARSRLPSGESSTHCEECDTEIPEARRIAIPGVRLCVECQSERERRQTTPSAYNRRGSKDSQLK